MIDWSRTTRTALPEFDMVELREYCNLEVDDTSNDKQLFRFFKAALDCAEQKTNRFFTKSDVVISDYDNMIKLPQKVDAITKVKFNSAEIADYTNESNTLVFSEVGAVEVELTTLEDMPSNLWMFILKYILHQLERNNPDSGELDYSDIAMYMQ